MVSLIALPGTSFAGDRPDDRTNIHRYIASIAERAKRIKHLRQANAPEVGIFWFAQTLGSSPEIFGSRVPAEFGKTRGIYIDGTEEHDGYWTSLQRCLHRNGIDAFPFLPGSGPNDWPRGKVAFNAGLNRFEVGMSQHLVEPQFMGEILEYFHLPKTSTRFSADPRYANVRFRLSC